MKKKISLILGIIVFVILAVGSVGGSSSSSYSSSSKEEKKQEKKAEEPKKEETPKEVSKGYKPGMYKVGSDIPAGEYVIFADSNENGYYERDEDSAGDSIIDNDNFETFVYANFKDGEYVKISGAIAMPSSEVTESLAKNGVISKGMYKVGKDIEPGEYKITTNEETYWERTDKDGDIIDNDNFENTAYVTVKKGEYFTITDGQAEKIK